jgi:hypothetical protein
MKKLEFGMLLHKVFFLLFFFIEVEMVASFSGMEGSL